MDASSKVSGNNLKIIGYLVSSIGLLLFLILAVSGYITFTQITFEQSSVDKVFNFVKLVLFMPGIVPLILVALILTRFKNKSFFWKGLIIVLPFLIAYHYSLIAVMAHDEQQNYYFLMQTFEVIALVGLIVKRKDYLV